MENKLLEQLTDAIALRVVEKMKESSKDLKQEVIGTYLTVDDVCKMLHVSKSKLYRHQKLGYVKPVRYVGRTPLFDENTIQEYLNVFAC